MNKRSKPINLTKILPLLLLLIIPDQIKSRTYRRSNPCLDAIELTMMITYMMIGLTNKPVEGEHRRRATFLEKGEQKPGGVTIKSMTYQDNGISDIQNFEIFKYDKFQFGAPGQYIQFTLNLSKYGGKFTDELLAVKSDFVDYGYREKNKEWVKVTIEGEYDRGDNRELSVVNVITGLKVRDQKADDVDFEVIGVGKEPKSWILRLMFYLVNFVFICCLCHTTSQDFTSGGDRDGVSLCYAMMEIFMMIMALKMVIFYWFVHIFWFMLIILIGFFCVACSNSSRINLNWDTPRYAKIYIILGAVITIIQVFGTSQIFPFAVLYAYLGLGLDVFFGGAARLTNEFLSQFLYQAYMIFTFYNLANPQYYYVNFTHFWIFIVLAVILHLVIWILYKNRSKNFKNGGFNNLRNQNGRDVPSIDYPDSSFDDRQRELDNVRRNDDYI